MIGFFAKDRSKRAALIKVKRWAETLCVDEHVVVRVTEIACAKPGCAPIETVVMFLPPGGPTRQIKLNKPASEIDEGELRAAYREVLGGDVPPR